MHTLRSIQFNMENQSFGERVKHTAKKTVKIILTSALILGLIIFSFLYWGSYSSGVRSGVVVKVSKKGFLFKTYEGQLNLETFGAIKGSSVINQSFDFSIDNGEDKIFNDLEQVSLSGEHVNLHYTERYVKFFWRGDTKYFVTEVERSKH